MFPWVLYFNYTCQLYRRRRVLLSSHTRCKTRSGPKNGEDPPRDDDWAILQLRRVYRNHRHEARPPQFEARTNTQVSCALERPACRCAEGIDDRVANRCGATHDVCEAFEVVPRFSFVLVIVASLSPSHIKLKCAGIDLGQV